MFYNNFLLITVNLRNCRKSSELYRLYFEFCEFWSLCTAKQKQKFERRLGLIFIHQKLCRSEWFSANFQNSQKSPDLASLTLLAPGFFGWCSTLVFSTPPPLHNSFVFKVRQLKFCSELLWDKMNILRQRKSESNRQWRHYDVIFSLLSIKSAKKDPILK